MTSAERLLRVVRTVDKGPFRPVVWAAFRGLRYLDRAQTTWARRSWKVPAAGDKDPIFQGPGPLVIGATGGSGTRVLARAVRDAGCYIGDTMNFALDCTAFTGMWGRPFDPEILKGVSGRLLNPDDLTASWLPRYITRDRHPLSEHERAALVDDLLRRLAWLLRNRPSPAAPWGWKFPDSIHFLPLFDEIFPDMRFIHVVRDGRDMAFSKNRVQLRAYGRVFLGPDSDGLPPPVRAALLWNRMNMAAASYGQAHMGDRYLVVRFEDLCANPAEEFSRVWRFMGFPAAITPDAASRFVSYGGQLGRWRGQPDQELLRRVTAGAEQGLRTFGYLPEEN